MIKRIKKDYRQIFSLFQSMRNEIWIGVGVVLLVYSVAFSLMKWINYRINRLYGIVSDDDDSSVLTRIADALFQTVAHLVLAKVG